MFKDRILFNNITVASKQWFFVEQYKSSTFHFNRTGEGLFFQLLENWLLQAVFFSSFSKKP
jgi:hypothetical protein